MDRMVERVARGMIARGFGAKLEDPGLAPERIARRRQDDIDARWRSVADVAEAAIAEFRSALADVDFVIVPRELTPEMTKVGALYCNGAIATRFMWEDMLGIAPSP